jgi:predicted nucleotidyltransferase
LIGKFDLRSNIVATQQRKCKHFFVFAAPKFGNKGNSSYICSKLFGMAMLVLQDCINKLGAFKQAFGKQFGIRKLGIFGSVARQENTEDSDIDIVVEIDRPTLQLMYELKEKLKELFKCDVDLIRFRSTLRPLFKSNILNDVVYV